MHQTTRSLMFLLLVWTICLAPPLSAAEATGTLEPEKLTIVFQDGALEINGTLVFLPTKIETSRVGRLFMPTRNQIVDHTAWAQKTCLPYQADAPDNPIRHVSAAGVDDLS